MQPFIFCSYAFFILNLFINIQKTIMPARKGQMLIINNNNSPNAAVPETNALDTSFRKPGFALSDDVPLMYW
jgi:hypothetical protein